MKLKQVNNKYYRLLKENILSHEYIFIEDKRAKKLKNNYNLDLFYSKQSKDLINDHIVYGNDYIIIEAKSGRSISFPQKTLKKCKESLKNNIKRVGYNLNVMLMDAIEKNLSPRYQKINN